MAGTAHWPPSNHGARSALAPSKPSHGSLSLSTLHRDKQPRALGGGPYRLLSCVASSQSSPLLPHIARCQDTPGGVPQNRRHACNIPPLSARLDSPKTCCACMYCVQTTWAACLAKSCPGTRSASHPKPTRPLASRGIQWPHTRGRRLSFAVGTGSRMRGSVYSTYTVLLPAVQYPALPPNLEHPSRVRRARRAALPSGRAGMRAVCHSRHRGGAVRTAASHC